MSFTPRHLDILVALRASALPVYVELVKRAAAPGSYERVIDWVAERARSMASDSDDEEALIDLTPLLAGADYRDFLAVVSEVAPDKVPVVQQVLESKEYEQRLARTKAASLEQYLDELRVVTADEIASALINGTIVNATGPDGRPLRIRSDEDVSAAFLATPTATAVLDSTVLVDVLAAFAARDDDLRPDPRGLRLREVVVVGELDLNWLKLDFPLGFEGCDFHHWVSANHLSVPWLSFDSCDFTPWGQVHHHDRGALNASSIQVSTSLRFWGCRGLAQLFIPDAVIGDFSPSNPNAPDADNDLPSFRTVIDGARFGRLWIPSRHGAMPFDIDRSVRVDMIGLSDSGDSTRQADRAVAEQIHDWLVSADKPVPEEIWGEFEQALRRSGRARAATELGVLGAQARTREKRLGWLHRLVLGATVRYFYDNLRALRWLLGLLALTFVLAFAFADEFVASPLGGPSTLPDGWFESVADRTVWSLMYAADTVLSPLSLGQAETVWPRWSWLTLVLALVKGASLLLLGLLVVGVTGLAERRTAGART